MVYLKRNLPKKSEDLSEWYNRVVLLAELADYGPAKGTMIFRPYGFAIWELIREEMDRLIKARGVENAYFPLFIPESLLHKEQKHVEGFSPELAVVTIGGGEELKEKLVVRPTSETVMYEAYSRWIQSWRDLPVLLNQWNNVVRWEKRTYLFLRTTEFLWQEGHTAHADHEEAWDMVTWAARDLYSAVYRDFFAIPGYLGRKSEAEKFAGADVTLSYEALMPEGKVLQSATAHDLGQNFSKTFDIKFQTKAGEFANVWQTSWGLSTRSIGALVMMHGDDAGLRLPPRLAPVQAVILPVKPEKKLLEYAKKIAAKLAEAGIRVKIDDSDKNTLGSKINKWELKGVPLRLEVGDKEVAGDMVTAVRRDSGEKLGLPLAKLGAGISQILEEIQNSLYAEAEAFLKRSTHEVNDYAAFKKTMAQERGFISAFWCEDPACEQAVKQETKATTRVLPLDAKKQKGKCIYCGKPAADRWLFGLAY